MAPLAVLAANRFGLGARPGELAAIGSDPRAWLAAQIQGPRPLPAAIGALPSSVDVFKTYVKVEQQRREMRDEPPSEAPGNTMNARRELVELYLDQVLAR